MKGLNLVLSNVLPQIPLRGVVSISLELDGNLPVSVVDNRGRGIPNVFVSVANTDTGTSTSAFTDASGNVVLQVDSTNPNPITVTKDKAFKTINFTGGNSFTIEFDPPLL